MIMPELCSTRYFSLFTAQHSLVGIILSNMAHWTGVYHRYNHHFGTHWKGKASDTWMFCMVICTRNMVANTSNIDLFKKNTRQSSCGGVSWFEFLRG